MNVVSRAEDAIKAHLDGRVCFTCSFQAEDVALLHMLAQRRPDVPVLFLETGYHFAATYAYRDDLARRWGLNLVNVMPRQTVGEQEGQFGRLYETDPGRCCKARKVEPLMRALEDYDTWFTGLRREQSPTRANLQVEESHTLASGRTLAKISPLAEWTWKDVQSYLAAHEIGYLPLYDEGYTSIGCEPCTAKPAPGTDARSGRWGGKKLECGIHTFGKEGH